MSRRDRLDATRDGLTWDDVVILSILIGTLVASHFGLIA